MNTAEAYFILYRFCTKGARSRYLEQNYNWADGMSRNGW